MVEHIDMQHEVDSLAADLGQSVLIEDVDQFPVWWSTLGAVDPVREKTILYRSVDAPTAEVVNRFNLDSAKTPVRTPAIEELKMWPRWAYPIRHSGQILGYLWILDPEDTINQSHFARIISCAERAAEVMATAHKSNRQSRDLRQLLLNRLLVGPDVAAANELLELENLPANAQVQVEAPAKRGGWQLPNNMSAHVGQTQTRNATSGDALPLVELAEAVRRASATRRAIAAGAHPQPESWNGLGAWRFIVDAPADLTIEMLHPGAAQLASQSRDELLTTARVVFDCGGDIQAAAAQLHIHRTTLYYRLDRIQEITGVDLRKGSARTDMQLALWLAAYRATT